VKLGLSCPGISEVESYKEDLRKIGLRYRK
jgi:hypothetical protein